MADHSELVSEMLILEQMGTQERQKLAKKRRLQQIKKWNQREKEWIAKEKQINKRLASRHSEENNGLNLKHYTQFSHTENSPNVNKQDDKNPLKFVKSSINKNEVGNTTKQNNVNKTTGVPSSNTNNNNNVSKKNANSKSISLNGLDAEDLCSRPINSKVRFDAGVMLLEAAARNDLNEVRRLLTLGVSPDSTNHDGLTTLHQGCIEASEPMINLLLEFGANVDARDTEQWTPLHAACTCGHLNLVRILVERGADLLAINGDGNMPFDLCEDMQTSEYLESKMVAKGITQEMIDDARASTERHMINDIQRLINKGIDVNSITYSNGITPVHVAAANGYLSALKFLIKHGADINARDNDQWQPLHGVACWGNEQHIKIIELLIEAGASLDDKTINDETVFDLCDNEQILEKLNEIKDEIESKQAASDADRLRRTHSRTNSRIHSIRRTSVRDKSQISRRDALEEALLRSDSSLINISDPSNKSDNNDIQSLKGFNGIPQDDNIANDNDDNNKNRKVNVIKTNSTEQNPHKKTINSIDSTVRQDQKHDNGIETSYLSTDLDAQPVVISPKQMNSNNYISDENNQQHINENYIIESQLNTHNSEHEQFKQDSSYTHVYKQPNNIANKSAQDTGQQPITTTSGSKVVVQFNSTSYTLSNLKKHRSDFRARAASIGDLNDECQELDEHQNNSVNSRNDTTRDQNNQRSSVNNNKKSNEITITSSTKSQTSTNLKDKATNGFVSTKKPHTNNEILRNRDERASLQSPDSSLRRFRGEPSELVGGTNGVVKHGCCSII